MLSNLLKRLIEPETTPLPDADARLALTALLVRIARSDGDFAEAEAQQIDKIATARYGLTPADAMALRREAGTLEASAPDTVRFTRAIKDQVPLEDRIAVIEALWEVVLADGARDEEENSLLRMIAPMLGITDRDSNMARQRVEARQ